MQWFQSHLQNSLYIHLWDNYFENRHDFLSLCHVTIITREESTIVRRYFDEFRMIPHCEYRLISSLGFIKQIVFHFQSVLNTNSHEKLFKVIFSLRIKCSHWTVMLSIPSHIFFSFSSFESSNSRNVLSLLVFQSLVRCRCYLQEKIVFSMGDRMKHIMLAGWKCRNNINME